MNYIKHLTAFFEKVVFEKTLNPTHISLYIALFQFWNCNRFRNPISINRDEVMRISKISSKATYHKCLKNLHSLGFINYEPSYNPFKGSHVYLFDFSDNLKPASKHESVPKNELPLKQALNKSYPSNETSSEQVLVPSINSINKTNILNDENISNIGEPSKKIENGDGLFKKEFQKEKSSAKKEKVEIPTVEAVTNYFIENNFPEIEAQKFFNYFSSNGWLVGGKAPMVNWNAAAQNWMLNSFTFVTPKEISSGKTLNVANDKNYAEPL